MPHTITLYTKPGCHLCEDARKAVDEVVDRVQASDGLDLTVEEIDILERPELRARYGEEIPVVLIDGRMHTYWRVDAVRFERALKELA